MTRVSTTLKLCQFTCLVSQIDNRNVLVSWFPTNARGSRSSLHHITFRPCVVLVPNYSTARSLPPRTPPPTHYLTKTLEPWAAYNMPTNAGTCSTMAAALNADIETLATAMKSLEDDALKATFGAVVSILGLVRVRVPSRLLPHTFF